MTKDNKILKTKEEMKFYAKEFIKNVVKFPLIFIKRISIITLAFCNTIAPIVIVLLIPMSINWILETATLFFELLYSGSRLYSKSYKNPPLPNSYTPENKVVLLFFSTTK